MNKYKTCKTCGAKYNPDITDECPRCRYDFRAKSPKTGKK